VKRAAPTSISCHPAGSAGCAAIAGADVAETAAELPDDVCIVELHPTQQQA
jgi:hypothetical protein